MRRRHSMPFGAEVRAGGVRFRLWAPAARSVELVLYGEGEQVLEMDRLDDGWHERLTRAAHPGSRYRYRIDGEMLVPDPASRCNPEDVTGPSQVIDPAAYRWRDQGWRGRPWSEAVIYELHVGCFTQEGTFEAICEHFDYLQELGVTAIEIMPMSDFPGARNWGYDGVLPFAPDSSYGRPEHLKAMIDRAHLKGLMVLLDVVYNHFGPEGNYLAAYAPQFFTERHHTPWGAAINFDGPGSRNVRDFFIHNALYWLEEFHFDGLRFDAVHAILDDSLPDILTELAARVRAGPGRERETHLVLENDRNAARYLQREASGRALAYNAQWNDDIHHALHVLATGETDGYYTDYAERPLEHLGRCLAQGFAYQGESSRFRDGRRRGEPSAALPPSAFVGYLQTHDQVGNRAFGERLHMLSAQAPLRALTAVLLLSPAPPLVFMGEEFAAPQPFQFFCDFGEPLASAVREGRAREFADFFARHGKSGDAAALPDPCDPATFRRCKLDWSAPERPEHAAWLSHYRKLLALRRDWIVPHLGAASVPAEYRLVGESGLLVDWRLEPDCVLHLVANLGPQNLAGVARPRGELVYANDGVGRERAAPALAAWSVGFFLENAAPDS